MQQMRMGPLLSCCCQQHCGPGRVLVDSDGSCSSVASTSYVLLKPTAVLGLTVCCRGPCQQQQWRQVFSSIRLCVSQATATLTALYEMASGAAPACALGLLSAC